MDGESVAYTAGFQSEARIVRFMRREPIALSSEPKCASGCLVVTLRMSQSGKVFGHLVSLFQVPQSRLIRRLWV